MKSFPRMNLAPTDELGSHRSHGWTQIIIEHESHEFHELFRADDTSIHMQVTVATATENLWKSVQSVGV